MTRARSLMPRLDRLMRDRRGGTALEVGILAPLAVLMLTGVIDHGLLLQQKMRLESAARAGAEVLVNHPGTSGFPLARAAAVAAAGGTEVTVPTPTQSCICPVSGSAGGCATLTCPPGETAQVLLTMVVERSYTPLFRYPWMAGPVPLAGHATLRVR